MAKKTEKRWEDGDIVYYVALDQSRVYGMKFDTLFKSFLGTYNSKYSADRSFVRKGNNDGLIFRNKQECDARRDELNAAIKRILKGK